MRVSTTPSRPSSRGPWRALALPLGIWALMGVALSFTHRWIPASTWLLVHTVTLGLVTNAIVIFSDHFSVSLLKSPAQGLRSIGGRLALVNAGAALAATGMIGSWPWVTVLGATLIESAMVWHGWVLVSRIRRSIAKRFASTIGFYAVAAGWLVLGAFLGSLLAFGWAEPAYGRLLAAHQGANLIGFVGTTVMATWVTFWPMTLRTKIVDGTEPAVRRALSVVTGGVAVLILGALVGQPLLAGLGALAVTAAYGWLTVVYARPAIAKPPVEVSPLSLGAAWLWGLAGLAWFTLLQLTGHTTAAALQQITPVWTVGFGLQMVLGALSYLFPMLRGGGPANARRGHRLMNQGGGLRLAALNGGLLLFLLSQTSWIRVVASIVCLVALVWFLVLCAIIVIRRPLPTAMSATITRGPAPTVDPRPTSMGRRDLLGVTVAGGALLGLGAIEASRRLRGQGPVETAGAHVVDITISGMRFHPSTVHVPSSGRVVLRVTNAPDNSMVHDLALATGQQTPRLDPGASSLLDLGTVSGPIDGWCTIIGHRQAGMTLTVVPDGTAHAGHQQTGGADALARRVVDLEPAPGADYRVRDAALPATTPGVLEVDLVAQEKVLEIAPATTLAAMTFNGQMTAPTLRATQGQQVAVHLRNEGTMGHSLDFHAGTVRPDEVMRTIEPGQELDYRFVARRAGIWLYHCSTMPMSTHIAAGMCGAVVVSPADAKPVDHEWVLVQQEGYLAAENGQPVNADKIVEARNDLMLFNGHANQYVHEPLRAKPGERIRIWVLAAGPNKGIAFHVVGAQFDTVYKEGAYLLRGGEGGSQVLDLAAAQGGFVEMTIDEPGRYTFVNHSMVEAERGARGLIVVE